MHTVPDTRRERSGQPWPDHEVLWLHPPWCLGAQVEAKLQNTMAAALVVCPAWPDDWVRHLVGMSSRRLYYEPGGSLFEQDGQPVDDNSRGTWILRVDKGPRFNSDTHQPLSHCTIIPTLRTPKTLEENLREMKSERKNQRAKVQQVASTTIAEPPTSDRPKMLDLFSGTGSVGKVFADHGFEVTSVDNDPQFEPTLLADVLTWDCKSHFKPGHFDTIFASPACTEFSRAKTTAPPDLELADSIVRKTLEIIRYLKPKRWFLENPRNGLLSTREYMAGIPFVDVDYCQFSHWGYQKPTRVWGDLTIAKIQPKLCDGETCENLETRGNGRKGHQKILGGNHMTTTRKEKYRVPEALVCYLCGWSDPEMFETAVQCIHVLQLHATKEVRFEKSSNQLNLRCLAHQLDKYGALEHYIQSVVCAQEPYEG